jgi:hypothetical protein
MPYWGRDRVNKISAHVQIAINRSFSPKMHDA